MPFHFDVEALKKHPYTIGGVIIVGGLIIFYLLSKSGSSATASDGGLGEALQYDENQAQVNASLAAQQQQTQAQTQQAELEAQVSNTQTAASLDASNTATEANLADNIAGIIGSIYDTNASTVNNANEEVYTENVQSMADAVLENQTNAGVYENANNNATNLAATELGDNLYAEDVATIAPNIGKQYNSGGDLESATALEETILANGNPGVAALGSTGVASVTTSGNTLASNVVGSISNLLNKLS